MLERDWKVMSASLVFERAASSPPGIFRGLKSEGRDEDVRAVAYF